MTPTEIMLLATYRSPVVKLDDICDRWFNLSRTEARRRAALHTLPVPAWRATDSQKAPFLVGVVELGEFIDAKAIEANRAWAKSQA